MNILGLHGGFTVRQHEASAAIIMDGKVMSICEEERYLRSKSAYGLMPIWATQAALHDCGLTINDIDLIVTPGKTYDNFDLAINDVIRHNFGATPKMERVHHQLAHIATAFYASGFDESICLSLDASGDGSAGFIAYANKITGIKVLEDIPNTNSLGLFYTAITHHLGFSDGDEYKVMGLAPYGKPHIDLSQFLKVGDSCWSLNHEFLKDHPKPQSPFQPQYSSKLSKNLGQANRRPDETIDVFHKDLAASVQKTLENALMYLITRISSEHPEVKNLCFSGGIAMNCSANFKIINSGLFDKVYIPPVSSDRGLSLGCAYLGSVSCGDIPEALPNAYLGSFYDNDQIKQELDGNGCRYEVIDDPFITAANLINSGNIIGMFQGRSEAGARALGNRSILASPGGIKIRDEVNKRIKFRESFRPFAPVIKQDSANDYFEMDGAVSPYMCSTFPTYESKQEKLAAVTHVDGTSRVQTLSAKQNPGLYKVLEYYEKHTALPVLLNTSFNLKGQAIVETPRDAIMTFFGCGLDKLILGNFLISKN